MPEDFNVYEFINELGFPILVLVFLGIIIMKLLPEVVSWIRTSIVAREKQIAQSAESTQVSQHCAHVIENNTEQLSISRHSQELVVQVLGKHMDESRDAFIRIEATLAEFDKKQDKVVTDIQILKERTA